MSVRDTAQAMGTPNTVQTAARAVEATVEKSSAIATTAKRILVMSQGSAVSFMRRLS